MRIFALSLVTAAALPSVAAAGTCAPPGNSGVQQYLETVPGAGCNRPPGGPGHHGGGALSRRTAAELNSHGAAGRAVAQLVRSSGTAPHRSRKHGSSGPAASIGQPSGKSVLPALLHPIVSGSGGGLGVLLPLLLLGALILVAAAAAMRWRRTRLQSGT